MTTLQDVELAATVAFSWSPQLCTEHVPPALNICKRCRGEDRVRCRVQSHVRSALQILRDGVMPLHPEGNPMSSLHTLLNALLDIESFFDELGPISRFAIQARAYARGK